MHVELAADPDTPQSRRFSARHPWLVVGALTLLTVVVVDVGAGTAYSGNLASRPSAQFHHELVPSLEGQRKWGSGSYWMATNNLGLRDASARDVPLTTSAYRLLFLGDSVTEGLGVAYEDTFAGQVGTMFQPGTVEVLNGGVTSYAPRLQSLQLAHLLEDVHLHVDEVAVFIDISDAQDEIIYDAWTPGSEAPLPQRLSRDLARHSLLYRQLFFTAAAGAQNITGVGGDGQPVAWATVQDYLQDRDAWTRSPELQRKWARRGLELAAANMLRLVETCRIHGVRVSLAVYPWPSQIKNGETDCLQKTFWMDFGERHGVPVMELFSKLVHGKDGWPAAERNYIPGDIHLSERGHQFFAVEWLRFRCGRNAAPDRLCDPLPH